jgi:sugar transferase (PEP-CTERM/EpsH1 system associated)
VRILFLSQRVPYPPNRGDKITTWRLIDRMRRSHEVTCVAFAHDQADLMAARELDAMGIPTLPIRYRDRWKRLTSTPLLLSKRPLTLGVYGSRQLQATVDRLMPQMDLAYAYSSSMGAFLEKHAGKPRIMHLGELDSDKWRQYGERAGFPMSFVYRREARTLLEFERRIAHAFTENVLCTPLEQKIFQQQIPGASSTVLQNGVDLAYYKPTGSAPWHGHIVFTGVMNYFPNVDACTFFVKEVFPLVRREFPGAKFTIVGSQPTPEIRQLGKTLGVSVTGYVADTRKILRTAAGVGRAAADGARHPEQGARGARDGDPGRRDELRVAGRRGPPRPGLPRRGRREGVRRGGLQAAARSRRGAGAGHARTPVRRGQLRLGGRVRAARPDARRLLDEVPRQRLIRRAHEPIRMSRLSRAQLTIGAGKKNRPTLPIPSSTRKPTNTGWGAASRSCGPARNSALATRK